MVRAEQTTNGFQSRAPQTGTKRRILDRHDGMEEKGEATGSARVCVLKLPSGSEEKN